MLLTATLTSDGRTRRKDVGRSCVEGLVIMNGTGQRGHEKHICQDDLSLKRVVPGLSERDMNSMSTCGLRQESGEEQVMGRNTKIEVGFEEISSDCLSQSDLGCAHCDFVIQDTSSTRSRTRSKAPLGNTLSGANSGYTSQVP